MPILSENTIKYAMAFIAAVGLIVSIFQFSATQKQANKRPFLEKQFDLCFEASNVAATLSTTSDERKFAIALGDFWRLYWGGLAIVEDSKVEKAMVEFGTANSPIENNPVLLNLPLKISKSCRNLILDQWDVDIEM